MSASDLQAPGLGPLGQLSYIVSVENDDNGKDVVKEREKEIQIQI